jgi:hypothetical protein
MFATQSFRTASKLLILATLLVAAPACRTGTTPEAGIDQRLFEQKSASLGYNPRGYWFAVAAQNSAITDYVTIAHDGHTELFYAVARGERAAQLLPLTPVQSTWFADAVEAEATPVFVGNLDQAQLSDSVGLWSGETGDAIKWFGKIPSGAVTTVALPAKAPESVAPFSRWARGVVGVSGGEAKPVEGDFSNGPFLLLPETGKEQQALRVVNLSKNDVVAPKGSKISVETQGRPAFDEGSLYEYALLPVGRQQGADLIFFDAAGSQYVFNVGPDHARLGDQARLVAAVAETPLSLRNPKAAPSVMRGFQAIRDGRPLAAAYWLSSDDLGVAQNPQAGALRLAELPAAAGLTQWSRVALLEAADGMSADRVLYLARAHALEGDMTKAIEYASDSAVYFRTWPSPTSYTGAASARLLRAHLEHAQFDDQSDNQDDSSAIEQAQEAVEGFQSGGDALRQADAELQLAHYLFGVGSPDNAVRYANLARSRYYHAGSPYFSALAEIALAEFMLDSAQSENALEMAGYARARMQKFGEPVGLSRARLVEVLAQNAAGKKRDISGELKNVLARAKEHKDLRTQVLAASALVTRAGVDDSRRIVELGSMLLSTRDDIVDPFAQRELQRALAALCGQGFARLAASDAEPASTVDQACAIALKKVAGDPATLSAWLDQGYTALQQGNTTLADSTASQLTASLDEQLETSSPVLAAQIYIFRYAVKTGPNEASGEDAKPLLEQAFSLLANGLDPASAPARLFDLTREHRARGLTEVAGRLGQQAMNAARDQKKYELEREVLFALLDIYQSTDTPSEVLKLARDGRKVVARAGPGSEALEARTLMYQSDAEYRLGRTSDGGLHRSNALAMANEADDATHLDLLVLAARLDMERRAIAAAEPLIGRALGIYDALGPKIRTEPGVVTSLTQLHTLHGEFGVRLGKLESAQKAFDTALQLSKDNKRGETLAHRADALVGRAGLADAADAATYEDKLVSLLDQLGGTASLKHSVASLKHCIEAHRAGVEYFTDAGDASQALDVAERIHDLGFSLAPRHVAACVIARPRLFAGKDELATQNLETCAADNAGEPGGEFATLLLALTDNTLDATARAKTAASVQETLGDKLTATERARLVFIQSLANPENSYDKRRAGRLEKSARANQAPGDVEAFASYLLSVGRPSEASAFTDEHSSVFFEQGQESPGTLIGLRLEAMVRQLQPVEAALFARRALSESTDIAPKQQARIDFLLAQNEVIAGRWWSATRLLTSARTATTDRSQIRSMAVFAKKFPLMSPTKVNE